MAAKDSTDDLKRSISQSGLLFQAHPDVEGWEATRAGLPAEIAAFKNEHVHPEFSRLSVLFYAGGEEDEDGIVRGEDTWSLEFMDMASHVRPGNRNYEAFYWGERESFHDREAMLTRLLEIMQQVTNERPTEGGAE